MSMFVRWLSQAIANALWAVACTGALVALLGLLLVIGSWLPWSEVALQDGILTVYLGALTAVSFGWAAAALASRA